MKCPVNCVHPKTKIATDLPKEQILAHCIVEHPTMPVDLLRPLVAAASLPESYATIEHYNATWTVEEHAARVDYANTCLAEARTRLDDVKTRRKL